MAGRFVWKPDPMFKTTLCTLLINLPYTGLFFMHKPYPWSPSSIDHIDRISLNSTMPFTYRHRARTGSGYAQPERACLTLTKK